MSERVLMTGTMYKVLMHIIVIAECVNRLSEEFKEKHNKIDWFKIRECETG